MDKITKQILRARPRLGKVAPLVASICWLFAGIDFVLFYALTFVYRPTTALILVNQFLTFHVWGIIFLILGIVGSYALISNKWELIRGMLLSGIIVKSAWEITLIVRTFYSPNTAILTAILWAFFTGAQIATYIFFMPPLGVRQPRSSDGQSD